MQMSEFGITTTLKLPYEEAVEKVRAALKEEGFGVLTEIDVKKTIKEKLGIDVEKYVILGACNPALAHRAISADPYVGLLLPCNVIVFEKDGGSVVSAVEPISLLGESPNEAIQSVAREVKPKLERVIQKLG